MALRPEAGAAALSTLAIASTVGVLAVTVAQAEIPGGLRVGDIVTIPIGALVLYLLASLRTMTAKQGELSGRQEEAGKIAAQLFADALAGAKERGIVEERTRRAEQEMAALWSKIDHVRDEAEERRHDGNARTTATLAVVQEQLLRVQLNKPRTPE